MPANRIAIFEGYNQGGYADPDPMLMRGHLTYPEYVRLHSKKAHRKRATSSPAQKRQQAKLKHCVRECKRSKPFRPCMSTCLRKQK